MGPREVNDLSEGVKLVKLPIGNGWNDSLVKAVEHAEMSFPTKPTLKVANSIDPGFYFADAPTLIYELATNPVWQNSKTPSPLGTFTIEVFGPRGQKNFYEAWHSISVLGLPLDSKVIAEGEEDEHISINPDRVWEDIGRGFYYVGNRDILRIDNLDDLRQGKNIFDLGDPYVNALHIPDEYKLIPIKTPYKDVKEVYDKGELVIFKNGPMDKDQFMLDDRILAVFGSAQSREVARDFLYRSDGQQLPRIVNVHKLDERDPSQTKGYLTAIDYENGFIKASKPSTLENFVALTNEKKLELSQR